MSITPANIPAVTNYHGGLPVIFNAADFILENVTVGSLIDYAGLYISNIFTATNNFVGTLTSSGAFILTGTSQVTTMPVTDNSQSIANTSWVRSYLSTNNFLTSAIFSATETISSLWTFNNNLILTGNINGDGTNRNLIIGLNACQGNNTNSNFNNNVVLGDAAAPSLGSGTNNAYWNVLIGNSTASSLTSGLYNVAIGVLSLASSVSGVQNVSIGVEALQNSTSNNNTAVGHQAGRSLTSGSNNTFVGFQADTSSGTISNSIAIGGTVNASNQIALGSSLHTIQVAGNTTFSHAPISNDISAPGTTNLVRRSYVDGIQSTLQSEITTLQTNAITDENNITTLQNKTQYISVSGAQTHFSSPISIPTLANANEYSFLVPNSEWVTDFVSSAINAIWTRPQTIWGSVLWDFTGAFVTVPTISLPDSSNYAASTNFVWNAINTIFSTNESITSTWDFSGGHIRVPTISLPDSSSYAASTAFVANSLANFLASNLTFSGNDVFNGVLTANSTLIANGAVDINNNMDCSGVYQTYQNQIITWNQTKTLGLTNVVVATISFSTQYKQTVTINTPVSLYRAYHNISANVNLANRLYDTLNSITYNIYKNSSPWQSGTCKYNNTIPNTQIFMGSSSSTLSQSYEIYITQAICSFTPDITTSTDSYVVYFTMNYSADTSYQSYNFVSDAFGYYVNTNISTDVIVGNGVINSGGYGSNYSAIALTTNISNSTNSGTGLLDANNISCNRLAVGNVVDNFNALLTSSSTLVQTGALFKSMLIPRSYFGISVTKGSPTLIATRYSIAQMDNTMTRSGTGQYHVIIYQNSYAPYLTAPDSTYISYNISGNVYATFIVVQVSGSADGYAYNGYVQVDKSDPNNWIWYAYATMQNGLGTYNEPTSGTFNIQAVCFW